MRLNNHFIHAMAGAAVTMLVAGTAVAEPVTVVSWGGTYGAAQDNALFNDASKNTGIEIIRESGASMSKTCLQVESGSVTWDRWFPVLVVLPMPLQHQGEAICFSSDSQSVLVTSERAKQPIWKINIDGLRKQMLDDDQ